MLPRSIPLSALVSTLGMLWLLVGCSQDPVAQPDDPTYAPVQPAQMQPPPSADGSLYQQSFSNPLFGDRKAYRIGDVITIQLTERTRSSKSATTEISKEASVNLGNPTLFGKERLDLAVGIDGARDFSGDASSDQSNSLTGNITVTVHQVYPNGNLFVRGEKWLTLNQGSEFIRVSGIIRPEDITPENTIPSTKLADARLTYSGSGDLAESNRQGWLTKFFNSEWWPF